MVKDEIFIQMKNNKFHFQAATSFKPAFLGQIYLFYYPLLTILMSLSKMLFSRREKSLKA